jgi:hypothetical protein
VDQVRDTSDNCLPNEGPLAPGDSGSPDCNTNSAPDECDIAEPGPGVADPEPAPADTLCGGIAGIPCPGGLICVDDPAAEEAPAGPAADAPAAGDPGTFGFFSSSNLECVVKAFNACGFNNSLRVFAAGLTDVRVQIQFAPCPVRPERRGVPCPVIVNKLPKGLPLRVMRDPGAPIQDTSAFATCP